MRAETRGEAFGVAVDDVPSEFGEDGDADEEGGCDGEDVVGGGFGRGEACGAVEAEGLDIGPLSGRDEFACGGADLGCGAEVGDHAGEEGVEEEDPGDADEDLADFELVVGGVDEEDED